MYWHRKWNHLQLAHVEFGKFCVLKGAVNLWCSAQRDSLKEECSRSIFHIWLLSPFTFSIVPPSNNVTSWKLSKEGFMSGRNSTEGKHLVDVIFHFSKFHKAICRSVDCEDLFWKTGRFYHICWRGKTQISHFSTLDGSELIFCQYFGTKYWVWKMPCLQIKFSSQTDGNEKITGILLEEMIQKWLFTHKDN